MDLTAGPQASGKSTFFAVAASGYHSFNIDDHRKTLNKGSAQDIPADVKKQAIDEYESFIETHLKDGVSFSIEVTLAKEEDQWRVTDYKADQPRRGFTRN